MQHQTETPDKQTVQLTIRPTQPKQCAVRLTLQLLFCVSASVGESRSRSLCTIESGIDTYVQAGLCSAVGVLLAFRVEHNFDPFPLLKPLLNVIYWASCILWTFLVS